MSLTDFDLCYIISLVEVNKLRTDIIMEKE